MVHGSGAARRQERALTDVTILYAEDDGARARSVEAAMRGSGFAVSLVQFDLLSGTIASPAIVALWSRTMAASRAAVSLGQSALGEGRLVSGRLDINVPSSLFPGHAMHDLVRWGGDPDDACLDGLIAEADRCVIAARAAPPPEPPAEPVRPATPPPREDPPRSVASAGGPRAVPARAPANDLEPTPDPAAEEAIYWRSIRASNDRADFQAYMARYGQEGLFAELAMERLRALTPPAPPPAPPPPQAVARFADSWRFGADWSTKTSAPPQRGPEPRAPEVRPPQPRAPEPRAADPQLAERPIPQPAAQRTAPPPAAPLPLPSENPPLNGQPYGVGGEALRRAGPQPRQGAPAPAPRPAAQRDPIPSPVRIPTPEAMARAQGEHAGRGGAAFDRELADAPWERGRGPTSAIPEVLVAAEPPMEPPVAPVRARRRKKGGMGGWFLVLLLLGGAGAAYWYRADLLALVGTDLSLPKEIEWPYSRPEAEAVESIDGEAAVSAAGAAGTIVAPSAAEAGADTALGSDPVDLAPAEAGLAAPPVSRSAATPPRDAQPQRSDDDAYVPPLDFLLNPPNSAAQQPSAPRDAPAEPSGGQPVFSYGRPVEESAAVAEPSGAATGTEAARQQNASVVWARRPDGAAVSDAYPEVARRRGVSGRAVLRCMVLVGGALDCATASEQPARMGFGNAALRVASRYRAAQQLSDGSPSTGRETQLTIVFKPQ